MVFGHLDPRYPDPLWQAEAAAPWRESQPSLVSPLNIRILQDFYDILCEIDSSSLYTHREREHINDIQITDRGHGTMGKCPALAAMCNAVLPRSSWSTQDRLTQNPNDSDLNFLRGQDADENPYILIPAY